MNGSLEGLRPSDSPLGGSVPLHPIVAWLCPAAFRFSRVSLEGGCGALPPPRPPTAMLRIALTCIHNLACRGPVASSAKLSSVISADVINRESSSCRLGLHVSHGARCVRAPLRRYAAKATSAFGSGAVPIFSALASLNEEEKEDDPSNSRNKMDKIPPSAATCVVKSAHNNGKSRN